MKKHLPALFFAALVTSAASSSADVSRADLTSLARGADRVVVATVTDVDPVFQSNEFGDRLIVSRTHLRVDSVLKNGNGPGSDLQSIVMELEGGTIGDLTLTVSDLPSLERGERAVVFLRQNSRGVLAPHGRGHGILKLDSSDRVEGSTLTLAEIRNAVDQAR